MAKDLPYFKFNVSEWNDGDITLCSMEAQGLFINLCSLYWSQEGTLTLTKAKRRYNDCNTTVWDELINESIIKVTDDNIIISFLDRQFKERDDRSKTNAKNVGKRWEKQPKNTTVLRPYYDGKEVVYNIEERREEKKREENTLNALCLVFGKKYKQPLDTLPQEVGFYQDINNQYDILEKVISDSHKLQNQILGYIKHCDNTGRKRIATAYKLAETILSCDWVVLNNGHTTTVSTKDPYEEARYNKSLWTLKAWEEQYADKIAFDKNFRKAFGYDELRKSSPVGSNAKG